MMIVDIIEGMINEKLYEIKRASNKRLGDTDSKLLIYIDTEIWQKMMAELNGAISSVAYDVYNNKGWSMMGYPIYKVVFPQGQAHGIKVFEDLN